MAAQTLWTCSGRLSKATRVRETAHLRSTAFAHAVDLVNGDVQLEEIVQSLLANWGSSRSLLRKRDREIGRGDGDEDERRAHG